MLSARRKKERKEWRKEETSINVWENKNNFTTIFFVSNLKSMWIYTHMLLKNSHLGGKLL